MKSFLVSVGGAGSDDSVLETAMAAARPFAAHLNLFHVQVGAGQAARHSPHADFATGPALRDALADLETEAKVRTSAAEQHVREFCARSNISMLNAPSPTLLARDEKEVMTASWRVYPYALRTRKSAGLMMRKLSVTESQKTAQFFGTSSRRKCRTDRQKSL